MDDKPTTGRFSAEGCGLWTKEEHERFMSALEIYPTGPWKRVAELVGTRSARQTMTHAQKYRQKLARHERGLRSRQKALLGDDSASSTDGASPRSTASGSTSAAARNRRSAVRGGGPTPPGVDVADAPPTWPMQPAYQLQQPPYLRHYDHSAWAQLTASPVDVSGATSMIATQPSANGLVFGSFDPSVKPQAFAHHFPQPDPLATFPLSSLAQLHDAVTIRGVAPLDPLPLSAVGEATPWIDDCYEFLAAV